MKYKVGDKVKIREDLVVGDRYGADTCVSDMAQHKGEITTIACVTDNNKYRLAVDTYWNWTEEMLEDCKEDTEKETETYKTVDVGFHLDYCGHRIIKNVYYGGYAHDTNHVFCTTVDSKNQYTLPIDSIDFIIPHEEGLKYDSLCN